MVSILQNLYPKIIRKLKRRSIRPKLRYRLRSPRFVAIVITYAFTLGSWYVTSFTFSETRAVSMLATLYVVRMLGLFMV